MSGRAPIVRGYFESLERAGDNWHIAGWMLPRGAPCDTITVYVDDRVIATARPLARPDVSAAFTFLPDARPAGWSLVVPWDAAWARGPLTVTAIGSGRGVGLGEVTTHFMAGACDGLALPPEHLRERATASRTAAFFWTSALRTAGELLTAVAMRGHGPPRRVLDWGCGCGRVTALLPRLLPTAEIHGADIDAEAVAWCRAHISDAEFTGLPPLPPTPFPAATFDTVFGYSVFTHLTAAAQRAWAAELARLLTPGGVAIVSVHGAFALETSAVPPGVRERFAADGFCDATPDARLGDAAPADYYRTVFQNRAWTEAAWAPALTIASWEERGMMGFHDLVVVRRAP